MYHQPYGSTVHLEPLFNQTICNNQTPCHWLLPDKTIKYHYPSNERPPAKYSIASNGTLTIENIQSSDNGIYHFFRKNDANWTVSKAILNLRGAPYRSIWLEYWPNVTSSLDSQKKIIKAPRFLF